MLWTSFVQLHFFSYIQGLHYRKLSLIYSDQLPLFDSNSMMNTLIKNTYPTGDRPGLQSSTGACSRDLSRHRKVYPGREITTARTRLQQ